MKEPIYNPVTESEMKLRTKLKTLLLCEEDETPSFEDIAIISVLGLFVLVPMVLGLVVRVLNL
ncbi:MAG: hypothetical protein R3328_00145 [Planococcaceae bacterium]|nr:hypothetical protein [Planococcaceae bacterium]